MSRATRRPARRRPACSRSPRCSTTSRRWPTSRGSSSRAARSTRRSARARLQRATSCSACPATSRGRASTRRSSASRSRDLIEMAGGVPGGRAVKAVNLGGAAGVFVGPEAMHMPLTFEHAKEMGATLGAGAVVVFDETTDIADILRRIAEFFRDESCGQCVPCRVGTVRQEEVLARLAARPAERERRGRAGAARGPGPGDAGRVDLRPRPDGERRRPDRASASRRCPRERDARRDPYTGVDPVIFTEHAGALAVAARAAAAAATAAAVEMTIDGTPVDRPRGRHRSSRPVGPRASTSPPCATARR